MSNRRYTLKHLQTRRTSLFLAAKPALKKVFPIFAISRIIIICVALLGTIIVPMRIPEQGELLWNVNVPFFNLFARWDSAYYLNIAREGYVSEPHWAFRPFFPIILRILTLLLSAGYGFDASATILGFLINNLFLLGALFLIYRLTLIFYQEKTAYLTIVFIAFFPSAVFYSSIYAESLYLFLLTACFYTLETEKTLTSGSLGFLAGLTRPEGFLTSIIIVLRGFKAKNSKAKLKSLSSALLAILSFPVFLGYAHFETGNLYIVYHSETTWNKTTIFQMIGGILSSHTGENITYLLMALPIMLIGFSAVFSFFVGFSRNMHSESRIFPYYLLSAILLIIYVFNGDGRSIARLFSTIIPMYWSLGNWVTKRPKLRLLILFLFTAMMIVGTILFTRWYQFF
jgi:Gpi18-like mannosyltransferase